jgi:hypothetical protein
MNNEWRNEMRTEQINKEKRNNGTLKSIQKSEKAITHKETHTDRQTQEQ